MKVRDIVTVHNGSCSMSLVKGEIQHKNGFQLDGRRFRVCDVGGSYPTDNEYSPPYWTGINNILLVDVNDPDFVLFTQERFCDVGARAPDPKQKQKPKSPLLVDVLQDISNHLGNLVKEARRVE